MERHVDQELGSLNQDILKMGAFSEEAIYKSIEALKNKDGKLAKSVIDNDHNIDQLELDIDEKCIDLIARYQPMAKDLRFITTGMKINAELERIADICFCADNQSTARSQEIHQVAYHIICDIVELSFFIE